MSPAAATAYMEQLLDGVESTLHDKGLLGKDLRAEVLDCALPIRGLNAPAGALRCVRSHVAALRGLSSPHPLARAQVTRPCRASSPACPSSGCATDTS